MKSTRRRILELFSFKRIIVPVLIGLAVILLLMYNDLKQGNISNIRLDGYFLFFLAMALLMMVCRDVAYMYRIRLLTDGKLTWRKAFQVILLWEFVSSVTPTSVGGTPFAIFMLHKEKISAGRSTAIVMITTLLDELFFIIMLPLVVVLAGKESFSILDGKSAYGNMGLFSVIALAYLTITLLTSLLLYGVFGNPNAVKKVLIKAGNGLRRIKLGFNGAAVGAQLIDTSVELRSKPTSFWLKAFGATVLSWSARYAVVNFLIMAFIGLASFSDNLLIAARQLVMWVIMLISPTPGGSGIAEYLFSGFLREYIVRGSSDLTAIIALIWRMLTYYPYLIAGALILPVWLRRVYIGRRLIRFKKPD